jgi:hypothetical protein
MAKYLEGVAIGGVVKCPENTAQCGIMHVKGFINNGRSVDTTQVIREQCLELGQGVRHV